MAEPGNRKHVHGRHHAHSTVRARKYGTQTPLTHKAAMPVWLYAVFSLLALGCASVLMFQAQIVLFCRAWFAGISLLTFFAYWFDKRAARYGASRISEKTLLRLGLLGGWPGAILAQLVFRHKTRKLHFQCWFWITVAINVLLLYVLAGALAQALLR